MGAALSAAVSRFASRITIAISPHDEGGFAFPGGFGSVFVKDRPEDPGCPAERTDGVRWAGIRMDGPSAVASGRLGLEAS
jgi:hypothetical protein